jgi:hypothetical protein
LTGNRAPQRRINVAHGSASAHCLDCDARHIGMGDALADEDLQFLSRVAQRLTVAPGKVFIEQSEPASYVYNIIAGNVRVFKSLPDGRRHSTGFMGVRQFMGLADPRLGICHPMLASETSNQLELQVRPHWNTPSESDRSHHALTKERKASGYFFERK